MLSYMSTSAYAATSGSAATSTSVNASASATALPKLSQADAEALAKKDFAIPSTFTQVNANFQSSWMGQGIAAYSINWNMMPVVGVVGGPSKFINVTMDANTGDILQYDASGPLNGWSTNTNTNVVDATKAQQIATAWIQKLEPTHAADLILSQTTPPEYTPSGFSFQFVRMVNGVPAPFDSATIQLDRWGKLTHFQSSWFDVAFPEKPANLVSQSDATSTYSQLLNLHLAYASQFAPGESQPKEMLIYQPDYQMFQNYNPIVGETPPWIDATSGQAIGSDGTAITTSNQSTLQPLVPGGENTWPQPLTTSLTAESAAQLAETTLGIGSDYTLQSSNYNTSKTPYSGTSQKAWNLDFVNSPTEGNITVGIDATTGMIVNYNEFPTGPSNIPQSQLLSDGSAETVAVDFVKKVLPSLVGAIAQNAQLNMSTAKLMGQQPELNVQFTLLKNGISASSFNVNVNKATGTVQNYYFPTNQVTTAYPPIGQVISVADANAAWVKKFPLQLEYILTTSQSAIPPYGNITYTPSAELVYGPSQPADMPQTLDAHTGAWVDMVNQNGNGQTANDIKGHYGEADLKLLVSRGILPLKNGDVHPDATVTREQFIHYLVKAEGFYYGSSSQSVPFKDVSVSDPDFSDIMQAYLQGWLPSSSDLHPTAVLTRADAADLLTRFLGWNSLASKSTLFALPFHDAKSIPQDLRGDAAIAAGLGLIPATKAGNFAPTSSMTVADTAVTVVGAMQLRSSGGK